LQALVCWQLVQQLPAKVIVPAALQSGMLIASTGWQAAGRCSD